MELQSLAKTLAFLTILEPGSKTCELVIKLAKAGTTTTEGDEKTDTAIIKEIKAHLPELQKELAGIKPAKFAAVERLMVKILTPDA